MVVYYELFGRKVGSHVLSMITLGTVFTGTWLSTRGGDKAADKGPPIAAASKDEEAFIKEFLKNVESSEKKEAKH